MKIRSIKPYKDFLHTGKVGFILFLISFFLIGGENYKFDGEGRVTIIPQKATPLRKGEYTLRFVVGKNGIGVGGGIKARFPKSWAPQTEHPTKNDFLRVKLSRKESGYRIDINKEDPSLDGQREWNTYVITLNVTSRPLIEGDTISLILLKTAPGRKSAFVVDQHPAFTETLPVASDTNGDGTFSLIKDPPRFTVLPDTPHKLNIVIPTSQESGKEFNLKISVLDRFNNASGDYGGTVEFTSSDKKALLPKPYTYSKDDGGIKNLPVTLNTPGYHTVTVYDKSRNWKTTSNPVRSHAAHPKERIWWGDLHSHSEISYDGVGNGSFRYARDVAGLDFYSLVDHSASITKDEWNFTKEQTIKFHEPGKFVTILAYECSLRTPSGHHNVFFNCSNEMIPKIPIFRKRFVKNDILILWKYLRQRIPKGVDVITIPHHTGLTWKKDGEGVVVSFDKPYKNPKMRVAIEIFSVHGTSEKYNPLSPFSYGVAWVPDEKLRRIHFAKNGPNYAQDAWAKKAYLGVIASSDNHQAHPGMAVPGSENNFKTNPLAAVYADKLTRDSIFKAIKSRRTYATTGERIILSFKLNNHPMGSEIIFSKGDKATLSVIARGTDIIDFVEILKWDFDEGKFDKDDHPIFETILHKKINALDVDLEFVDDKNKNPCLYYVRLKQLQTVTDNQAWAWSSPIWVKK